ncbi:ATP-dependent Clp protease ATP-binding subunit [Clostridium sp. JN-1]|uniref:ATP-dependent Clp protease ATP-binding subunit n=1 Tax=Clostridium sp. JN-1 TaxID=2483110 RepID=UPI000F0AF68C|nr:ATP-dependent Clp protease ATP-binding subunit [Clostridium sp. JN-1]
MQLCSICHKNPATVFTLKVENGKFETIGLCAECAKSVGLPAINQLMEQNGIKQEDIENFSNQINNMIGEIDIDKFANSDMFMNLFNSIAPAKNVENKENDSDINKRSNDENSEEKDNHNSGSVKTKKKWFSKKRSNLDKYGTNLTEKAREKKIDNIIGRNKEIDRIIQILNRRTKNNPVLIGEPGVGKTAIAEGLALKIANKEVPVKLLDMEVYLLDLTAVVAGTQFRGQFEGRMKSIVEEVKESGNIIIVIDEIHNIIGAGEAQGGALNAANILKPSLARGEIQVIGTTTIDEYRKYIEKDSALERRFQPILVEEPTIEETIEILNGIKKYYEDYHKVKISNEVIEAAVNLSQRYISDRYLPDKAIDVIDEAASRANLNNKCLLNLENLKRELTSIQDEIQDAANNAEYQKAAELKTKECKLQTQVNELKDASSNVELTLDDIAFVIESWTKIPVHKVREKESQKLLNLENILHKRVIGQNEAVTNLSRAIRRNRLGFKKKGKPVSFIFVGPTGVGKTELVKVLSSELFGNEESLIRIDMSEYMEKHTVSKLIGAPPGYVGYDEGGQLTEKVRRKPYSVILLDEIEKAHPDVFNMLLQILEDGRLTDGQGRTVYFDNTIIIMTSNAGTDFKGNRIGFGEESYDSLENHAKDALKQTFKPEFLNRIDEIIVFKPLTREEVYKIMDLMIEEVKEEVSEKNINITVTDKVKDFILNIGYDDRYGARPLRRAIQRYIEDKISEDYLQGKFSDGSNIKVDLVDEKISIINE